METTKDLVKIYTGPEASAILLKARLEETGIFTLTKNELTSSYFGSVQPLVDIWINDDDLDEAIPLVDDFISNQNQDSVS
jgi:hypothetical protein